LHSDGKPKHKSNWNNY